MHYNIGVDIGGTFTDCVVADDSGRLVVGKALSTPDNWWAVLLEQMWDGLL